jgi:hypothetical protein
VGQKKPAETPAFCLPPNVTQEWKTILASRYLPKEKFWFKQANRLSRRRQAILTKNPQIQHLEISRSSELSDRIITAIIQLCPH